MTDVFLIRIDGDSDFLAVIASGQPDVEHRLYLFDHNGYGVLGGSPLLRVVRPAAGLYRLGVALHGVEPFSRGPGGRRAMIFPPGEAPQVAVAPDLAAGGSRPLAGWCGTGPAGLPADYFVQLSGARCAPRPLPAAPPGPDPACAAWGDPRAGSFPLPAR